MFCAGEIGSSAAAACARFTASIVLFHELSGGGTDPTGH
jgi:hypothetical protein